MFDDISCLYLQYGAAVEQTEELYRILLQDTLENGDNIWKIEQYLKNIRDSDLSFDFRMARNGVNGSASSQLKVL